jgi:hypothetical protein
MSKKTWFKGLNRKQKNVVVTASVLSLVSVIIHNPLGGYDCHKTSYADNVCISESALMYKLNTPNEIFLALLVIISLGGLLLYIFRDE